MSLFGSLLTGASAMNAQSQATSMIANNIANLNTTGFKRSEASFFDLVTTENNRTSIPGVVTTTQVQHVDEQGDIKQTSSFTDIAVSGNGFFAVKQTIDPNGEFLYTRNGAFNEFSVTDDETILRNTSGFFLYGWALDENGNLPGSQDTLASLVPIDVSVIDEAPLPTTEALMALNLDAGQASIDPHRLSTPQQLPVSNEPAHYVRTLRIFDAAGGARDLTIEFRKIVGPMAHFTSDTGTLNRTDVLIDPVGPTPGIAAGDVLQITDGGNTLNVTFIAGMTTQDMLNAINNFLDGGGNRVFEATLTGQGHMLVQAISPTVTIDISGSDASVLGSSGFNIIPDPDGPDFTFEPDASLTANGLANPNQTDFPAFADALTPNTQHWWEMRITIPDPADPANPNLPPVELTKGLINFDSSGVLNAPANAAITIPTIDFDSSSLLEDLTGMTIDISRFSQFSGNFNASFTEQNGALLGQRTGVKIAKDGTVSALFSNGLKADLYKIPLVLFNNANGLQEISGAAYAETEGSGMGSLQEIGGFQTDGTRNGAGFLTPSTIETANVDLAYEFASLIVSQRAFTASSQLIGRLDEMTQRLSQLSR